MTRQWSLWMPIICSIFAVVVCCAVSLAIPPFPLYPPPRMTHVSSSSYDTLRRESRDPTFSPAMRLLALCAYLYIWITRRRRRRRRRHDDAAEEEEEKEVLHDKRVLQ